jgi:hypothetical protein
MGLSYHTSNTHKFLPQLTKLNNRLPTLKYGNQEWTQNLPITFQIHGMKVDELPHLSSKINNIIIH